MKHTLLSLLLALCLIPTNERGTLNANDPTSVTGTGRKQISDINMLLPVTSCEGCRKVSYQISAINGCYQWEVSHPNLIEIEKIPSESHPDCSNVAIVTAVSSKPSKSLIWISAKDKNSGQVLRCEVKLGLIQRLEVQTHLRQFYLNDYEHLTIAAYDEEGNIFSGLSGFRFDWNIESGNQNIKIVSWREASRTQSELSKDFEYNKLQSEVLFLKGINQGTAVVTAKITEPGYEEVALTRVQLSITEPFVIIPQQTVYLLPTSRFQFQLAKVTLNNDDMAFTPIKIPSKQYQWNVDDDERGMIGEDGMFISKDKEGFANILVVDKNIANNTAESSIKVVFPQLLDIEISDVTKQIVDDKLLLVETSHKSLQDQLSVGSWDNNWIMVQDHYYLLKVFIYDGDKHLIHMTDNVVIKNLVDSEFFEIVKTDKINAEIVIKAKKPTNKNQKIVYASYLQQIKSQSPKFVYNVDQTRLRAEKEIIVTEPVRVNHLTDLVLLPILRSAIDENKYGEIWHLTARGGSGYYIWSILDDRVAQISGQGVIRSIETGLTTIIVKDSLNQKNQHSIQVEVTPITSLQWLEDHIEVKKNVEDTTLNLIALDKKGRKFTNCTSIEVMFDLKGAGIIQPISTHRRYDDISSYVSAKKDLIFLRQRFEENPSAKFASDLQSTEFNQNKQDLLLHNNFGICAQQTYQPIGEGLARVKVHFTNQLSPGQSQILETPYAEIAAYDSLVTKTPNYQTFFSDLQSYSGHIIDEATIKKYYSPNTFIVAFGSSVEWLVSGGTNFWKDIPEKYQSVVTVNLAEKDLDKNILKSSLIRQQTSLFQYSLHCQMPKQQRPHDFTVVLSQQNQVSRYLLKPAHHTITLTVICEPPKSIELHWAQKNKTLTQQQMDNLPKFRVFNQEKHNYVLVNSAHYIRYLVFDSMSQVFYNHSSINTEVTSSNDHMAKVSLLNTTYQQCVLENNYDVRKVAFTNQTGTVYLNAHAKSSVNSVSLPSELKTQMRVEVVKNVDVQPKYKSIYLHKDNRFTFKIMHGSGHFSVSINNTDLADKAYMDGERTITIIPKREGPILVKVEDIEIPDSQISYSELMISDINRLELDEPGTLIEQGSSMDINVTAFDSYGDEFDQDQYRWMKFNMEIEISQQRDKGLSTEIDTNNNRRFVVKGNEPGIYQVTALSLKYTSRQDAEKVRVASEMLKVEVFPLLEIQPSTLLLTPQMRYTLQILGGPSRSVSSLSTQSGSVEIRFDVDSPRVASVDPSREVTGLEVGDTHLYYEVIQIRLTQGGITRRSIISKKTLPIRVRLVTSIDIPYNDQRTVYAGGMIKMFAILKYQEEVFTHGIAPISYSWNSSNQNVLNVNTPQKDKSTSTALATTSVNQYQNKKIRDNENNNNNAVFLSHFNSSTIYTTGGKQGEAQVTLQLAIEYPEQYKSEKNWFTKTITLRVKDKLTVEIPEFINNPDKQTHLYLMPTNAYSKIETNRKTRLRLGYSQQSVYDYSTNSYQYKEIQTPIISLVNEEGIRTFDKYGKVTVIIEENQAFSDQVVMLNLLITDIFNLAAKDVYQTLNFPLGSQINIPIKFQNEHGHQFANNIEGIEVALELSHPKVVSASLSEFNSSLELRAEGSGECNVKIYLVKQPHVYDIFRVRVQSVVRPQSPVNVHVGANIQFKIMETSDSLPMNEDHVIWGSNSPHVIDINQKSGEATALHEGKAEILLSNNINSASIVHVSKVKIAEVDPASSKALVINTDQYDGDFRVRVKLFLDDRTDELTPTVQYDGVTLIRQNVRINCQSDSPAILQARGHVSDIEGFFCILSFKGKPNTPLPKSSSVVVTIYAPNPQEPNDMKKALYSEKLLTFDVTYLQKIQVERSVARGGIKLSNEHRRDTIPVLSNTHFSIEVENHKVEDLGLEMIKYKLEKPQEDKSEYFLTVSVPHEITHDFMADIFLVHPITHERTKIPVSFEQGYKRTAPRRIQEGRDEERPPSSSRRETRREIPNEKEGSSYSQIMLIILFAFCLICFILVNVLHIDPMVSQSVLNLYRISSRIYSI